MFLSSLLLMDLAVSGELHKILIFLWFFLISTRPLFSKPPKKAVTLDWMSASDKSSVGGRKMDLCISERTSFGMTLAGIEPGGAVLPFRDFKSSEGGGVYSL